MTVGEHSYQLDANRWGYKFAYLRGSLDAEISYTTSGADWAGFNDYDWTQDKTLQYKFAFANRGNPLEFGYYGARGSWPLAEGGFDQYYTNAFYAQRDPGQRRARLPYDIPDEPRQQSRYGRAASGQQRCFL